MNDTPKTARKQSGKQFHKTASRPAGKAGIKAGTPARKKEVIENARSVAANVLQRVERDEAFSERTLRDMLNKSKLEARDRAMVTELCYGTLRYQIRIDWILGQALARPLKHLPPLVRAALRLGIYQLLFMDGLPAHAVIHETVELLAHLGERHKGLVNAILRRLQRGELPKSPLGPEYEQADRATILDLLIKEPSKLPEIAVHLSYPAWHAGQLANYLTPRQVLAFMWDQLQPAKICLRNNCQYGSRESLIEKLTAAEFTVQPCADLPEGLLVEKGRSDVATWPGFAEGAFSVQDGAAQLAGYLLRPAPDATVLELCAAPGGKTTHLLEEYPELNLTSVDVHPGKLELISHQIERLGLKQPHLVAADATDIAAFDRILNARKLPLLYDAVLCDAPCSGMGTMRRHPELRVRSFPEKSDNLAAIQRAILENALAHLKPGGILLFTLCTLSEAESFKQVADLQAAHPELILTEPTDLPEGIELAPNRLDTGLYCSIANPDMDKFFYARFVKSASKN